MNNSFPPGTLFEITEQFLQEEFGPVGIVIKISYTDYDNTAYQVLFANGKVIDNIQLSGSKIFRILNIPK